MKAKQKNIKISTKNVSQKKVKVLAKTRKTKPCDTCFAKCSG